MKQRYVAAAMALSIGLTLLSPTALAVDRGVGHSDAQLRHDRADGIFPDLGGGGTQDGAQNPPVTLPDPDNFHSNADFRPYDPGYPEKSQYGNYTLQVPQLKGRLTFSAGPKNQVVGTLFAPGTSLETGWKDATKQWGHIDSGLCFAASSSNLISWYLDQHKKLHPEDTYDYVTDVEAIFNRYRKGWNPDLGGDPKEALS